MDMEVTLTAVSDMYTIRSKRSRREAEEAETRRAYGGLG
jgi:hypothetical protein